MSDMSYGNVAERDRAEKSLSAVNRHIDVLFNRAPVMMHSIDEDGRLVKVNRRWLQGLGYKRSEVLGQKSVDFLTEESRTWVIQDALPLFWRVGSARSIGTQFVRKDGRVLDILLDAERVTATGGNDFTLAVLRKTHDLTEWEQASTTIRVFQGLTGVRRNLESVLSTKGSDNPDLALPAVQQRLGQGIEAHLATETLVALLEFAQDISLNPNPPKDGLGDSP